MGYKKLHQNGQAAFLLHKGHPFFLQDGLSDQILTNQVYLEQRKKSMIADVIWRK